MISLRESWPWLLMFPNEMPMNAPHLFVWRAKTDQVEELSTSQCVFCNGIMKVDVYEERHDVDGLKRWVSRYCTLCGWGGASFRVTDCRMYPPDPPWNSVFQLRAFDISSAEVALSELGSHLKRRYSDIYSLDDRRFEELVADVFADQDREVILTQKTHDGGVDFFIRNKKTNVVDVVVECKRYAENRKVGIAIVQRLAGVALEWQARKALVVTSSGFTSSAIRSAKRITGGGTVGMDLVAATELLRMLDIYNDRLPSLHLLTPKLREEIARANHGPA